MMLKEIRNYILSHHEPKDYNRCFFITLHEKRTYICSRCAGWYTSFLLFWILSFLRVEFFLNYSFIILYFFPMPAIIDWSLHRFKIYEGTNLTRIFSGFLIGLTFATLLYTFLKNPFNMDFWLVSITYSMITFFVFKFTK